VSSIRPFTFSRLRLLRTLSSRSVRAACWERQFTANVPTHATGGTTTVTRSRTMPPASSQVPPWRLTPSGPEWTRVPAQNPHTSRTAMPDRPPRKYPTVTKTAGRRPSFLDAVTSDRTSPAYASVPDRCRKRLPSFGERWQFRTLEFLDLPSLAALPRCRVRLLLSAGERGQAQQPQPKENAGRCLRA